MITYSHQERFFYFLEFNHLIIFFFISLEKLHSMIIICMNSSSNFFLAHSFSDMQVLSEKKPQKQPPLHVLALPIFSEKVWCCRVLDAMRMARAGLGQVL